MRKYENWEWLTLADSAEESHLTENKLLRLAAAGDLPIWVRLEYVLVMPGAEKTDCWFRLPFENLFLFQRQDEIFVERLTTTEGIELQPAYLDKGVVTDVIQATMDLGDKWKNSNSFYNTRSPYQVDLDKPEFVPAHLPIKRSELWILLDDIEKLSGNNNKTDLNKADEPYGSTEAKKPYSGRVEQTNLKIIKKLLEIVLDDSGFFFPFKVKTMS